MTMCFLPTGTGLLLCAFARPLFLFFLLQLLQLLFFFVTLGFVLDGAGHVFPFTCEELLEKSCVEEHGSFCGVYYICIGPW